MEGVGRPSGKLRCKWEVVVMTSDVGRKEHRLSQKMRWKNVTEKLRVIGQSTMEDIPAKSQIRQILGKFTFDGLKTQREMSQLVK